MQIKFKGPFIVESNIDGEKKKDCATPNYATGMKVSEDRWLIIYDTVDCRGCDFWRSILYQIRAEQPYGEIINSGVIAPLETHHRPFGDRYPCWKGYGNANIFGCSLEKEDSPSAGVFAISYNSRTELWYQKKLVQYSPGSCVWPEDINVEEWKKVVGEIGSLRMMKQYRFNPEKDEIELIAGPEPSPNSQNRGVYHDQFGICNWGNPVAVNDDKISWYEIVREPAVDSCLQVFQYDFDSSSGIFKLTTKGKPFLGNKDFLIGEPSLVKLEENNWLIAARCNRNSGKTLLFRCCDPLSDFGDYAEIQTTYGQRMLYRFADGKVGLTYNNINESPYQDRRNPLYCDEIDLDSLKSVKRHIVYDAREDGRPFHTPFVDHTHLFESFNNRQILAFRLITARQVWQREGTPLLTDKEMQQGGLYCCEVSF